MKKPLICFLSGLLLVSGAESLFAQGTAFSYQGRLTDNAAAANGNYDFTFAVFDAAADGARQGPIVSQDNVAVESGQFRLPLDFGPIFTGAPRWLQIGVRKNGNAEAHMVLVPRQALLPTPYAIYAGSAGAVANGTVAAGQLNTGGIAPAPGQFLSYDGGNLVWSDPGVAAGNIFSLNGTAAYYTAGSVGLGTSTPTAGYRLEVTGATILRPGNGTVQFGSPNAELGLSITPTLGDGNSRADLRFNGSVLKLVAGASRVPPSEANGLAITTAGNVGIGTASPGFKLDVRSDTSTAIVGRSTVSSGVGVYGESAEFNGVRGVANNVNHGAVVGVHNSAGVGVLGQSTGVGVFGNSLGGGAGVYGESAQFNGVRGLAHNANHGGVVGVHDGGGIAVYGTGAIGVQGDGTSVGVYGRSASGAAVHAEGNATQAPDKGGFVKAMAYIGLAGETLRCYNGVTGVSTIGVCGITSSVSVDGVYRITFPFRVDDRFVSLTAHYGSGNRTPNNMGANFKFVAGDPTSVDVLTYDANDGDDTYRTPFMIFVF